jgi:hypothetical protein
MLKNWSRIALASFLVLMVGASVASATTARVRSLGNTGDYISDDSAVNRWYSTLSSFANQVNAELGQYAGSPGSLVDTRGLGWTHACGDDGKWGTYRISLNENALDHPGFWIGNPFYQDHSPGDEAVSVTRRAAPTTIPRSTSGISRARGTSASPPRSVFPSPSRSGASRTRRTTSKPTTRGSHWAPVSRGPITTTWCSTPR